MPVVRTIHSVAERTLRTVYERQAASKDDPKATVQAIVNSIGSVLTAERRYISEMIEDLPVMEQLSEPIDPQLLCNMIVDKLEDRNTLPTVLVDEAYGAMPVREMFIPRIVITIDPESMTIDDMLLGDDSDLIRPFAEMQGKPVGCTLGAGAADAIKACEKLKNTGEPQVIYVAACKGDEARNYMIRLQWSSKHDRIVASSAFRQIEQPHNSSEEVRLKLARAI
jgi:hypothetical protein